MEQKKYRSVIFYKDYFREFFVKQRPGVKAIVMWTLELIEDLHRIPETYLKHIENAEDFTKSVFSREATFSGYSVFLTKELWWYWQMVFKRKHKKHRDRKLKSA